MNSPTEEKLQAKLDEWFATVADYGEVEDEQAYQQIKECIHIAFTGSDEEDVIKEIIYDKNGFQMVKEENYHLGLKHGIESQQ